MPMTSVFESIAALGETNAPDPMIEPPHIGVIQDYGAYPDQGPGPYGSSVDDGAVGHDGLVSCLIGGSHGGLHDAVLQCCDSAPDLYRVVVTPDDCPVPDISTIFYRHIAYDSGAGCEEHRLVYPGFLPVEIDPGHDYPFQPMWA